MGLVSVAQVAPTADNGTFVCGHTHAEKQMLQQHPEVAEIRAKAEKGLRKRQQELYDSRNEKADELYVIPTVFHVIHDNGVENISYEQILSGIEVANLDLAGMDPSIGDVHADFAGRVADCKIELRLATIDPDGNCTNGVERWEDAATTGADDGVKAGRIWPSDKYLNIFVVKTIGSGAAGYAYYPGASSAIDGVLIRHDYVGNTGTSSEYRSAALVHEVGHYLNLKHTWGQGNDPAEADNCNIDDDVTDTPLCKGISPGTVSDCATDEFNTCDEGGGDEIDNHQNFMDYAYCYLMFTDGQKARMRAALESGTGDRDNLHTEANLVATGTADEIAMTEDYCAVQISPAKTQTILLGESITFSDESPMVGTNAWDWEFEGTDIETATTEDVTVRYTETGTFKVILEVSNGTITERDTFYNRVVVTDFEAIENLDFSVPASWTIDSEAGSPASAEWEISSTGNSTQNGYMGKLSSTTDDNGFAHATAIDLTVTAAPYNDIDTYVEHTAAIDLSGAEGNLRLSFEQLYRAFNSDDCFVELSDDNGASWDVTQVNTGVAVNSYGEGSVTLDLDEKYKVANFKIRFRWTAENRDPNYQWGGGYGWQIDDITIEQQITLEEEDVMSYWNGDGDAINWNDPDNWADNTVPGEGDEVSLDNTTVLGAYTVTISDRREVGDLSLNSNVTLNIENGASLTYGTIDSDGMVRVKSGGSLLPNGAGTLNGTGYRVERVNPDPTKANFWSSPVVNGHTSMIGGSNIQALNAVTQEYANVNGMMSVGRGYYSNKATQAVFTGTPNNGNVDVAVSKGAGAGYNLIGNPYPSAITAKAFTDHNNGGILTSASLYLFSQTNAFGSYESAQDIVIVNTLGSAFYDNDEDLDTYDLASCQGFGVEASGNGTVQFTNDMRNDTNQTFKAGEDAVKVWVAIQDETHEYSTLIAFTEDATLSADYEFDAPTYFGTDLAIASTIKGKTYGIQAVPQLESGSNSTVGLKVNIPVAGKHTFEVAKSDKLPQDVKVYIHDKNTGYHFDITNSKRQLSIAESGEVDKYELVVGNAALSTALGDKVIEGANAFVSNHVLNISSASTIKALKLIDLKGSIVLERAVEATNKFQTQLPQHLFGIYLLQVETTNGVETMKLNVQ